MKLLALLLPLLVRSAFAADPYICPGDPLLQKLSGYYALSSLLDAAPKLRSWPAALGTVDSERAGVSIRDGNVFLSLAWHEGDTGGHCVKQDASGLWVRETDPPHEVYGPYRYLASSAENESLAYLTQFLSGCFDGSDGTHWCFSRKRIAVDGKPFNGVFDLDAMELPEYGTSLKTTGGHPELLVFVPTPQGWAVYADTYVTAQGRVAVTPGRTKPSFLLTPQPKR